MRRMRSPFAAPALVLSMLPATAGASDCGSLDGLRWLLGDWATDGTTRTFHESWTGVGNGTFEGVGFERATADDRIVSLESLRLVQMSGGVFYVAKVAHNDLPVAFRLTECADGRYVFDNPAHDFPRRLEYRQNAMNALTVRVSDGAEKGFTLEFRRAAVAGPDEAVVLAAEDARFAAMVAADPAAMRRWLADGLGYVHSTGRVDGKEQLIDAIASGRIRYLSTQPVERRVIPLAPDAALVQGLGRFRVAAGDAKLDMTIRYLAAYVKQAGDWRLIGWQSLRVEPQQSEEDPR